MSLITATTSLSDESAGRRIGGVDFWLLGIRILVSVPIVYFQSRDQAFQAWGFVWEQKAWPLSDTIAALGLPQSNVISVTLIFLLLSAPLGLLLGFITRLNALVLVIALAFVLISRLDETLSLTLNPQSLLLYLGMGVILSLSGGGLLSFDALLTRRRHEKHKKVY